MTDKTPTSPQHDAAEVSEKRPLWRRLLKGAAWGVGAATFGMMALPTLVSWLPIEGYVSRKASALFPGTVVVDGFSVGWWSPIAVRRVILLDESLPPDDPARVLLDIQRLSISRGLIRLATGSAHPGPIRIDTITANIARQPDGTFNFAAYVPPAGESPASVEPSTREPFELDLKALLPRIPIPVAHLALDLEIKRIDATWRDNHPESPLPALDIKEGRVAVAFDTAQGILNGFFTHELHGSGQQVTLGYGILLDGFSSNGTLDFSSFRLKDFFVAVDDNSRNPNELMAAYGAPPDALLVLAHVDESGLTGKARLDIGRLHPVAETMGYGSMFPKSAIVQWTGSLSHLRDGVAEVGMSLRVVDVDIPAHAEFGESLRLDDIHFQATALLDSHTLIPRSGGMNLSAPSIQMKLAVASDGEIALDGSWDAGSLLRLARGTIYRDHIPAHGDLALFWEGRGAIHEGRELRGGEFSLKFRGGEWRIEPGIVPGAVGLVSQDSFTLEGFETNFALHDVNASATTQSGKWEFSAPAFATATGSFSNDTSRGYLFDGAGRLSLQDLSVVVEKSLLLEPLLSIRDGLIEGRIHLAGNGSDFDVSAGVALENLHLYSAMLPTGELQESIALDIDLQHDFPRRISARLNLENEYIRLFGRGIHDDNLLREAIASLEMKDLGVIDDRWLSHLLPQGMLNIDGDFSALMEIYQQSPELFTISHQVETGESFLLQLHQYALAVSKFATRGGAEVETGPDGIMIRVLDTGIQLEDAIDATLSGIFQSRESGIAGSTSIDFVVDLTTAVPFLAGYLEMYGQVIEMAEGLAEGSTRIEIDMAAGTIDTTTEFNANIPTLHTLAPMEAFVEGITTERRLDVEVLLSNPMSISIRDEGTIRLETAVTAFGTVSGIDAESRTFISPERAIDTEILRLEWQSAAYPMGIDRQITLPSGEATGMIAIPSGFAHVAARDIRGEIHDVASFSLNSVYTMQAPGLSLDYHVESFDMSALQLMMGDMLPVELTGRLNSDGEIAFLMGGSEISILPVRDYSMRIDASLFDTLVAMEGIELRDLNFTLGILADERGARIDFLNDFGLLASTPDKSASILPLSVKLATAIRASSELPLDQGFDFDLEGFSIQSPALGTMIDLSFDLKGLQPPGGKSRDNVKIETLADFLLLLNRFPGHLTVNLQQNLTALQQAGLLESAGGDIGISFDYTMIPDTQARVRYSHQIDDLSFAMPGMISIGGVSSRVAAERSFVLPEAPPSIASINQGSLLIRDVVYTAPMMNVSASNTRISFVDDRGRLRVGGRSESLLGGTFAMNGALEERLGNQQFSADFSLTGLDAATFFPLLESTPRRRREVDLFGTLRLPFALRVEQVLRGDDIRSVEFLEDVVVSFNVTRIETEVLRGVIRTLNEKGTLPGAQAVLAGLRVGSPVAVDFELRGGIVNVGVTLATAPGLSYRIPLVERLHAGDFLRQNLGNASDVSSLLLNTGIQLLVESLN